MRQQRGASYIAILIAIIGFCFLAKILIAVWSPYWDNHVLEGQIESLLQTTPKNTTPQTFINQLDKNLSMNNLGTLKFAEMARVTNIDGLQVKVDYEIRKNFMMNIDLVLKFEKDFDQRSIQNH